MAKEGPREPHESSPEQAVLRNKLGPEGLKHLLIQDGEQLEQFDSVDEENPPWFYRVVLSLLTELDLEEAEAQQHFSRIVEHKKALSQTAGRDVGFRVACLDYFLHIENRINNPKVVELELYEQLQYQTKLDAKTGCYNYPFFQQTARSELNRARRHGYEISVMLIDFDHFKEINDRYGHIAGDAVLECGIRLLKNLMRSEDLIARYGGDEFVLMLPHTSLEGASALGGRLRDALAEADILSSEEQQGMQVTISGGAASNINDADDFDSLMAAADYRLYEAKNDGKNSFCCSGGPTKDNSSEEGSTGNRTDSASGSSTPS